MDFRGPRRRGLALAAPGDGYTWYAERVVDGAWQSGGEGGSPDGSQAELRMFQDEARRGYPPATYAIVKQAGATVWVFGSQSTHTPAKWRQGEGVTTPRKWLVPVVAIGGGLLLLYLLSGE